MTDHITQWLEAYHDGELRGARRRRVEDHLAVCAPCRAELEEIRSLSGLLAAAFPEEEFLTADRFAANLALSLPRRPAGPEPRRGFRIAWWLAPAGLLAALVFVDITFSIGTAIAFAADTGLFGGSLEWLQGAPPQMNWFASAVRLFGDRLGTPGVGALAFLNDLNVLITQMARPLMLQALLAFAYLGWLLVWWLNSWEELKN
ncbi:MAG TPA: zf-HC2 domain-containing protein [Anaerolineales bacterium]|nr:zf-HC2 domain-containing protein [Anaerolineales bacterium]